MGGMVDCALGYVLGFIAGFLYFRLTTQNAVLSLLMALALCVLVRYMLIRWRNRSGVVPTKTKRARRPLSIASRKTAPRCALYGALYMALYLWIGSFVYLPLSLLLLLLAGLGFRKPTETEQPLEH